MSNYTFSNDFLSLTLTSWDKFNNSLILSFEISGCNAFPIRISSLSLKPNQATSIPLHFIFYEIIFGNQSNSYYCDYLKNYRSEFSKYITLKSAVAFKFEDPTNTTLYITLSNNEIFAFDLHNFLNNKNYKISNMMPYAFERAFKIAETLDILV